MQPAQTISNPLEMAPATIEDWRLLTAEVPGGSYFQTPDWVLAWWETVGGQPPTRLALWRDVSGRLEGVAALSLMRQRLHPRLPVPTRFWAPTGTGARAADHCGWPVLNHRGEDVRTWVALQVADVTLLLPHLDPEAGVPLAPPGARRLATTRCPRLLMTPDEPIGGSVKFRKQLRYYDRRLAGAGIEFRRVPPEAMTESILDDLVRLHQRRRNMKGQASTFDSDRVRLHRRLIAQGGLGRGPAAVIAHQDGIRVGVLYGFFFGKVFTYYQSGWEPEFADANLGTMLVTEAIRFAAAAGAREFDFLRGAEAYKYRFGAVDRIDEDWLIPRGVSGRLLEAQHRFRSLRRRLKRVS